MATFLTYKGGQLGGVAGLSGAHMTRINWETEVNLEEKKKTKMFLYHGKSDPMITASVASSSYEDFKAHGLDYSLTLESGLVHSLS